jgi:uncharacterized protein (TIGR02145 family)
MKNLFYILTILAFGFTQAQPQKVNYQAVALTAGGQTVKNQAIKLRLSIVDSSATGTVLYTETHQPTTDGAGQFSVFLGGGTATLGTFSNIAWSNGKDKFLKAEADVTGGTNYVLMGTSQIVSVPYAVHANTATKIVDSAGNEYQIKTLNGQPTLVTTPGNTSNPATFACGQAVFYQGESYPTVQIDNQCWFQKNVNAGTMILGANNQTNNGILEKYCYNNLPAYCDTFGGLYQWAEAVQYQNGASMTSSPIPAFSRNVQGICPNGWHVPLKNEVCALVNYLDPNNNCNGASIISNLAGAYLKDSKTWQTFQPNVNQTGFSAKGAGMRKFDGQFDILKLYTYFWTTDENQSFQGRYFGLYFNMGAVDMYPIGKDTGFSVRCLKD